VTRGEGPRGEGARAWSDGVREVAPLLVPTLAPEVPFGLLARLLAPDEPVEARIELHRLSSDRALQILDRAAASAETELAAPSGPASGTERPTLERLASGARELSRRVGQRDQELWRMGLAFLARTLAPASAERLRATLAHRLTSLGFRTRVPEFLVAEALRPPQGRPDEPRPRGYWHALHTDGVAAFFPFADETVLEPGGVLVGLLLEDAGPIVLDRWAHASHSWGLFGTTGSGKSFAAALLALRSRWMDPGLEIVVIDPLGEFVPWARALGGTVLTIGPGRTERWNPLDPATTAGDRVEKAARAGTLLRALFPSLKDEETAVLDGALHRLYSEGPAVPTFDDLARAVAAAGAAARRLPALLEVLTRGSLSYLNGPTTVDLEGNPLVLSLSDVAEDHRAFHLSYLLDAVHGRIRRADRRRLVVIDEAHLLARHGPTAEYLDGLVRVLRHYRAGFLLLSQHPEDFLRTAPGRSILRNLRATLLFRHAHVSEECREFFGLTESETAWLPRARLPKEAGYSEALLRFGAAHLPLAVVASTPEFELLSGAFGGRPAAPPEGTAPLGRAGPGAPR
jgi:hypothetical protein